jgi:hypothetical protein
MKIFLDVSTKRAIWMIKPGSGCGYKEQGSSLQLKLLTNPFRFHQIDKLENLP